MYSIKGTIALLMEERTGVSKAGREWTSREFVLDVNDEGYLFSVPFKAFGREADALRDCIVGDTVTVDFRPEGREHNGRWYLDLRVRAIRPDHQKPVQAVKVADPEIDDMPF